MDSKKIIQELKDGAILAVHWEEIDEMLGLEPDRALDCAFYENTGNFIPALKSKFAVTEKELVKILHDADVNWIADDHPADRGLLGHIVTRFFATKEPNRVRWLLNPNKSRATE